VISSADDMLGALRAAVADPTQVRTRALDVHAGAHDASHFLLIPKAVVVAGNAGEVGQLLRASAAQRVPLTFRAGGTSLSGQGITDGVQVDVRRNFKDIEVLDGGRRVRVQPGVTVRALNARLAPYGRKFGPDPASEGACTIGGVVANNSSGMACGTVDNTYQTLESLTVVLPSLTWNEMRVTEPIASGSLAVQMIVLSAVLTFRFPLVVAAELATRLAAWLFCSVPL
jgi:D-lactate dehydrogenase